MAVRKSTANYDIIVAGGGLAGLFAAIAAARQGAKVAIVQSRSMFGGNASSEVRMHIVGADCHASKDDMRETGLLEELLLAETQEAHRRAAELLSARWPLAVKRTTAEGALCRYGEEALLIRFLRMPQEGALSEGELLAAQRAARGAGADRCVLCVPGKTPPAILAKAERTVTPIRVIGRGTLMELAGRLHPATDEQLVALGRRKRRVTRGGVLALVFRRDKARRFFAYGLAMTLMYLLLGVRVYDVAGMVCRTMATLCRTGRTEDEAL